MYVYVARQATPMIPRGRSTWPKRCRSQLLYAINTHVSHFFCHFASSCCSSLNNRSSQAADARGVSEAHLFNQLFQGSWASSQVLYDNLSRRVVDAVSRMFFGLAPVTNFKTHYGIVKKVCTRYRCKAYSTMDPKRGTSSLTIWSNG